MIFQHTIQHQDPKEFDKLCGKFLNEHEKDIISVDYNTIIQQGGFSDIKVPGSLIVQRQIQFISFFFAFFRYTVEQPAKLHEGNGKPESLGIIKN